jgi:hypothetical protein
VIIISAIGLGVGISLATVLVSCVKNAPLVPECYDSCGKLHCTDCPLTCKHEPAVTNQRGGFRSEVLSDLSA